VKEGAVIPHIKLAQSTVQMDWSQLELVVYAKDAQSAQGLVCLPSDKVLHKLSLAAKNGGFALASDSLPGSVTWKVRKYSEQ
jgi:alpha-D-xyloside xylohydrolase